MEVLKYREIRILPSEWVEYLTDSSNDKAGASDNSITADNADITVEIIGNTLRQAGDGLGEVEHVVEVVFLLAGHPGIYRYLSNNHRNIYSIQVQNCSKNTKITVILYCIIT